MSSDKVCLDLFAGFGGSDETNHGFSSGFQNNADWRVVTMDIEPEFSPDICADVLDLSASDLMNELGEFDNLVVLAGHPCTLFSSAGNHDEWNHETHEPVGGRARRHTLMLHHTIGLVKALTPDYWVLENPLQSRARWFIGQPTGAVTYCQYGMDYQKPTGSWGEHPKGMTYRSCPQGADCHESNAADDGRNALYSLPNEYSHRSLFPRELSEEITEAVDGALENSEPEQMQLDSGLNGVCSEVINL
jgi:hypothetical protein